MWEIRDSPAWRQAGWQVFPLSSKNCMMAGKQIPVNKLLPLLPPITLLLLVLLAAAPVWGPGIVNTRAGGDSPFLLWRTHQIAANLRAGTFPVRWMPDAAYGYGYPFFSYYAALPFYLAGLLNISGVDILTSIKLTQTLGFIAAAFAMYGWTRRHFSQVGAWLAAVAYTFAAFHMVNVYTRGDSLSEFYAFVFYPLILWALDATFRHDARSVTALALAFGGLFVTHTLSAFIFPPFALMYLLLHALYALRIKPRALRAPLISCALGLGLGLALSAWVWAPLFFEKEFGQLGEQTTGYFNYSNHFRRADLVQPTLTFDYDVDRTTPFAMSSAQAALALLGVIAIVVQAIRQRKLDLLTVFTLGGLFISTWMITPLSRPVWDHLPLLPLVQFPWRFLSVQALFTALATGHLAGGRRQEASHQSPGAEYGTRNTYVSIALGLLMAVAALANLHPTRLYISPTDVTTERLQLYEMFTANIGTTIRHEYMPRQVIPRLYTSDALIEPGQPMQVAVLEGKAAATRLEATPTRQVWRMSVGTPQAVVAFPIVWWPGWQASVDGTHTPIRPAYSSGRIMLDMTTGTHMVVLWLGRTPLRAAAESASLAAAIALLIILVRSYSWTSIANLAWTKNLCVPGICAVIFLVTLAIWIIRSAPPTTMNDETMDFYSQPYLHHNPLGAPLKPDLHLMNYTLSADELTGGQILNIRLNWLNTGSSQPVTVKLVSPAQHLVGLDGAPTLAESAVRVSAAQSQTIHSLTVPPETPRGIYLIKVQTTDDAVYLRPVRVRSNPSAGDAPVLATFADGRIRLHRVHAEQVTPTQLAVKLDWSATQPVEANYAIALRVRDAASAGRIVTSIDTQPGYGFLPTSLWRARELIAEHYMLKLPEGTPPTSEYQIEIILYDAATLAGVGQYIHPNITLTLFARRPANSSVLAHFGPELALATLDIPAQHQQSAPTFTIQAGWLAMAEQSADRIARWAIYDSAGSPVLTQTHDLAAGTRSSSWPIGAYVVGWTELNIPSGLAAGHYHLGVTVLNLKTQAEEGSYMVPSTFEITGHPRHFALPPMQHRSDVTFGDQIRLAGYDLQTSKSQIQLTLHWQAITAPRRDYTVFVHLFNPTDERIAAQHDAMPLENRYPTSWWAAGETVSETVTLDLKDAQAGMYRLAVGLYDVRTMARLAALGPDGVRLDMDRVILSQQITVPK